MKLLTKRSESTQALIDYCTFTENQYGLRYKRIHSDNGKEYVNKIMKAFCWKNDI